MVAISITLGGCLNTFYPIYQPEDLVWNEKILGTWRFEDKTLLFTKLPETNTLPKPLSAFKEKIILVREITDKNTETSNDIALLIKIGDHYFLDRFPVPNSSEQRLSPLYSNLFLRQHSVYRVDSFQTGEKLFLQRVSDTRLKEQIEQKKIRIATIEREGGSLILASTEELQKHILKYSSDQGFYENDNSHTYRRITKK